MTNIWLDWSFIKTLKPLPSITYIYMLTQVNNPKGATSKLELGGEVK